MTYAGPPQQPEQSPESAPPPGGYPPPPQGYPPPRQGYPPPPQGPAAPGYPPLPGYPADQTYPSPPGYDYPPGPGYPAAPIPGYGPAQAYPGAPAGMYAPPKKRRKWPWIVGGIVVVVIAALVIVGVFFGRTGSGDPRTAVDKFWSALAQHDRGKAEQYVCSNKNLTKSAGFTELINDLNGYTIGPESGSGGTRVFPVTAHVTVAAQNGDITIDTTVKRSAGKWYVCDLANQ